MFRLRAGCDLARRRKFLFLELRHVLDVRMVGICGGSVSLVSNLFDIARFCFCCVRASIRCGQHVHVACHVAIMFENCV